MVRDEGPGVTADTGLGEEGTETRKEVLPVAIIPEDKAALYTPNDHVMEDAWCVEPSLSRHERIVTGSRGGVSR
jgi:hypothetical protein